MKKSVPMKTKETKSDVVAFKIEPSVKKAAETLRINIAEVCRSALSDAICKVKKEGA